MKKTIPRHRGEQSMLVMILACLVVIACVLVLVIVDQKKDHEANIRARGISIARLLAGLPSDELARPETYQSMLQLVSFSQGSQDFAYAALVDENGTTVAEVSGPGIIVPPAPISHEPSGWIGERELQISNSGEDVMEFHAPVFEESSLAGQIRLGFFRPAYSVVAREVSIAGGLSLIVFLLAPLFYFVLRREIKPLATAGAELERLLEENHSRELSPANAPIGAFMDRFNQFVDYAQGRIRELESDRGELVTSAKLISYKKTRIEAVLQTLPEAVMILDEHGKVTYANGRVTLLLGVSKEQVLSAPPRDWSPSPEVTDFLARYETTTLPRYANDSVQFKPRKDNDRTMSIAGYPLFSPNEGAITNGTLIIIRDVTQECLAQQSRSEFVAHLGHELKTPLNTLSLYSEVLLDATGQEEAQRIEAVNTIHDEVERLVGLVNNLLNMTRIEMGSMDLDKQRTRLADLLKDIADNLGRAASMRDIEISLEIPSDLSSVDVDKELLRVAINNLISNAIKYNQAGGRITIAAEENDEAIVIHVTDTGLGISEADQSRVFDKFYRSDSAAVRERTGHGLGLALTRQIVELHDGQVSVTSELGKGSTFSIALWKRSGLVKRAI
jgi:PAS domain S-box-containing protein